MAGEPSGKESTVAKTAGVVVFSGIALSILKTLNPFNNNNNNNKPIQNAPSDSKSNYFESNSILPIEQSKPKPALDESIERSRSCDRRIEIVKGDTLWGLSRKYGVSIDAIKEANGLEGDTIYAGKKLVIP